MIRLRLDESSGPVAPRFQYTIKVEVTAESPTSEASVKVSQARSLSTDGASDSERTLDPSQFERLWADIQAQDPKSLGDLVPEGDRRVGVSYNTVEIDGHTFTYLLNRLEEPENARHRAVVDLLKKLAD